MMVTSERIALVHRLEIQLRDYWEEVDFNQGRSAHLFYTEDARFEVPPDTVYSGRAGIAAFYRYRVARGARTALHLISNFRAEETAPGEAAATWYLQLYAADGHPPHIGTQPIMIARMADLYRQQRDGEWLCARRRFDTLFKDGIPITTMPDSAAESSQ